MNASDEGRVQADQAGVLNAKSTLVRLLARAGVHASEAAELIGLVEAGALTLAHREISRFEEDLPQEKDALYESGWRDGTRAVTGELAAIAERALRDVVGPDTPAASAEALPPVRRMEVERAKVAVMPLYLSFAAASDLDPEVSEQVLSAVLGTMTVRQRAGYAGQLTEFASAHRVRLERLYTEYGPGSPIAVHGRYSLFHSPTSVAVLERLVTTPEALREAWDSAELPPAWLEGLRTAWTSPA
ncbi:hypothetical protein [Streptomyces sp. NPDC091371]|uniref:hypothetical protein n=1 Tax=Streptomyces sp. NPDC091371 TaxID=3155303 RepID=UPI003448EEAA